MTEIADVCPACQGEGTACPACRPVKEITLEPPDKTRTANLENFFSYQYGDYLLNDYGLDDDWVTAFLHDALISVSPYVPNEAWNTALVRAQKTADKEKSK